MLKQRVIIKWPLSNLLGREGIIVVEKFVHKQNTLKSRGSVECKVLIGRNLSTWIPQSWLEESGQNLPAPGQTNV